MKIFKNKKTLLIACCAAVVVLLSIILLVASSLSDKTSENAQFTTDDSQKYIDIAQKVTVDKRSISGEMFTDSSSALEAFVTSFNKNSAEIKLDYLKGNSFATGGEDAFGTRYYVTAKKDVVGATQSTYTFYMTSAGENKNFDTKTLIPDADDVSLLLLSGAGKGVGSSSTAGTADAQKPSTKEDFGIGEIISNKPEEDEVTEPIVEQGVLPNRITLTFNTQGGTGGPGNIRVKNGTHLKSYSFNVPTKENYDFLGFFSEGNGKGTKYFDSYGIGLAYAQFPEDTTLFAAWRGKEIVINFDNAGGNGSSSLTAHFGSGLPSVSIPTRPGYSFLGYFDKEGGQGKQIYNEKGRPIVENDYTQNFTVYAAWVNQSFTVEHYIMGINGVYSDSPNRTRIVENPKTKAPVASFADAGILVSNGIVVEKASLNGKDVQTVEIEEDDSVLKIYYKRCAYAVTATAGDGVASVTGAGNYRYGQKVVLNAEVEAGYTWSRWYDYQSSSVESRTKKYTFTMGTSPVNLEAQASTDSYTITLDANGGTCTKSSIHVAYGDQYYSSLPVAHRTGYRFVGWGKTKGAEAVITENETFKNTNNITLYAQWEADSYTITLDMQGGQGGIAYVNATYGVMMPRLQAIPTRDGYTFGGYYASKNGQGIRYYSDEGTGVITSDFVSNGTIYAFWVAGTKTISYYDKDGVPFSGAHAFDYPTSAAYGQETTLSTATKIGYTFEGWYSDPSCTIAVTKVKPEEFAGQTIKLFAKWSPITIDITFDCGGATSTSAVLDSGISATYGTYATDIDAEDLPVKGNATFKGFFTQKNGGGQQVYNANGVCVRSINFTDDITVYAYWE